MSPLPTAEARLIDGVTGERLGGARLTAAVAAVAAVLDRVPPGLVLCLTGRDLGSVVRYLGVLTAGRPAIVWDPATPTREVEDLVVTFGPAAVLGLDPASPGGHAPPAGYAVLDAAPLGPAWVRRGAPEVVPHPQLRVLLGTSGSTGRPRLVRQSSDAVAASARAICAALDIRAGDVAVTTLPLFYTLGLSVLHSHLLAGATVVLDGRSLISPEFWHAVDRFQVTSITGVPHTYELLARKRWRPEQNPRVRTLTVSGGRLRDALVTGFHAAMERRGGTFSVMYGQTEAGSRICVLPPAALPAKLGSVGPPVPGVRLSIDAADPDGTGEVVCHSPAVMMGYAEQAEDLARGDDLRGTLSTGDRGRLDTDGYLWLSGRMNRIGKAFGVRVNLDAVEHAAAAIAPAAAIAGDDRIVLWCERTDSEGLRDVAALVARELRIHPAALTVTAVDQLPRRPNGKVDYSGLAVQRSEIPDSEPTAARRTRLAPSGGATGTSGSPAGEDPATVLEQRLTFGDIEVPYLYGAECGAELAGAVLDRLGDVDVLLLVVDERVTDHASRVAALLAQSTRVETFVLRTMPENKTLASVQDIMEYAVDRGLTRRSAIVAMGGGTAGNVAGLAASLLFRGTRLVHLPTTPVAAFDATISLKQAVNLRAGKNLCGTYFAPVLIACDLGWLTTVPRADLLAGLAEMVKNVLITAPGLEAKLTAALRTLAAHPHQALRQLLEIGIDAKAPYLRTDPHERQAALVFEYGHTAGHAIEFLHAGRVSHGEAVAWGMLAAAEVGRQLFGLSEADVATHHRLTALLDLPDPTELVGQLDPAQLRGALAADNKRGYAPCAPDEVLMVVLGAIGQPLATVGRPPLVPVPLEALMAAIDTVAAGRPAGKPVHVRTEALR